MPHKKNPDVFELTRSKCNKLQTLPQQIMAITNNLPSGYFRDLQIIKEVFIPAFAELDDCLEMAAYMLGAVQVNEHVSEDPKYVYMYSVEEVNRLVTQGVPFRDAYRQVGLAIEQGWFVPDRNIHHTHEGSIGNLCNDRILAYRDEILHKFTFDKVHKAEKDLLK